MTMNITEQMEKIYSNKREKGDRLTSGLAAGGVWTRGTLYKYFGSSPPVQAFVNPRPTAKPPGVVGKPTRQRGGHYAKTAELQHNNNLKKKIMLQFCNLDRVMEPETIGKNGASPKNLMSKGNFLKRFALLLTSLIVFGSWADVQNTKAEPPLKILSGLLYGDAFGYIYPEEYQDYLKDYLKKYPDSYGKFYPEGSLFFSKNAQSPFSLELEIKVIAPVKVKYSLYTYKKTFSQDGKRNYYQGITECGLVNPITTQADIDNSLDKIYEFPTVTETTDGYKEFSWDGYTDPKFTGQKYAVRGCVYVAAHNADTDELIDIQGPNGVAIYRIGSTPGIIYRIDEHKDNNAKVVEETLSGKVILAYPDNWPIKKLTALITLDGCGYGALPIDVVNQGAEAMVADINRRIPGDVVAHIALTNPTVDKDNPNIKIYEWKDIKTEDGKDFIPNLVKNPNGYILALIMEMDEMTYTGIRDGYIMGIASYTSIPPVPKSYTGIEPIEKSEINIISNETGFVVYCPAGVLIQSYVVYDLSGRTLKIGKLSGLSKESIPASKLRNGIYFVQLKLKQNGEEKTVTKKVVIQ